MPFTFKIIEKTNINSVIPLMQKLTQNKYPDEILKERFAEMVNQNYECAAIHVNTYYRYVLFIKILNHQEGRQ